MNLKANSIDVAIGLNSTKHIYYPPKSTTINRLNTATTNALNLEAVTFVSMLTIQNASTQSILNYKKR